MTRLATLVTLLLVIQAVSAGAGAVPCGGVDDTAAVQAALDGARGGGLILLPAGPCAVRALNGRNLVGVRIEGVTASVSRLVPLDSDGIMLDLTDSADLTLANVSIGNWNQGAAVPRIGLLTAQSDAVNPKSNIIHLDRVTVIGAFSWAAWLNLGGASSTVMRSQFYNFLGGIGTVVFLAYNWPALISPFGPLMTGTFGPTDWTFVGTEMHNFGLGVAFWAGGADSLRFFGGNMSVNGFPWYLTLNVAGTLPTGSHLLFEGTTFYTDDGSVPLCVIQSNQGPVPVTDRASDIHALAWSC